jgi:polyisoprenoid-binding protein YceI
LTTGRLQNSEHRVTSTVDNQIALPVGTYRIAPARSTLSFTTRHFFGLGRVRGSLGISSGTVLVASPATSSTVSARMPVASFRSGFGMRDFHVKSPMFLHANRHPDLTYQSTGLTRTPAGWTIHGTLTAHGASAPVDLAVVSATTDGTEVVIEATARVNRYAFGVTSRKGVAARDLDIHLTIVADAV